jgi:YD repeat-containing protein
MTQEIQRIAAAGADWAVTYSYDADGRLVGRTTPSDQAGVAYTYTARGLLASVNGTT